MCVLALFPLSLITFFDPMCAKFDSRTRKSFEEYKYFQFLSSSGSSTHLRHRQQNEFKFGGNVTLYAHALVKAFAVNAVLQVNSAP